MPGNRHRHTPWVATGSAGGPRHQTRPDLLGAGEGRWSVGGGLAAKLPAAVLINLIHRVFFQNNEEKRERNYNSVKSRT